MLSINDIVKDQNGIIGRIVDIDLNNKGYEYGVLFMDVDSDGGVYWSTQEQNNNIDCSSCVLTKINDDSEEFSKYLNWEKEYNYLYSNWYSVIDKPYTHEEEIKAGELRPTQKQLEELYSKYSE